MKKTSILGGIAAACLIAGFVLVSKADQVKMWDSISKGEMMEYSAYLLFVAAIVSGITAFNSYKKDKKE